MKISLNHTKDKDYISEVPRSGEGGMSSPLVSFRNCFFLVQIRFEIYLGILNKIEHFKKLGTSAAFFSPAS